MSDKPLVSIVIPTYNQNEKFLRQCIESALAQTYPNIRVIISDNHSTNNVPQVLQEYASKDERIEIIMPSTFLSISESFLFALSNAVGKYACYVSSDDILMPTCVEELVAGMLTNGKAIFAHGKALYFYPDGNTIKRWEYFKGKQGCYQFNQEIADRLLKFEYICFGGCVLDNEAWGLLMKRYTDLQISLNYSIDILITFLLFEQGDVFYSDKVLVKVRLENDTRDSRMPELITDAAKLWETFGNDAGLKKMLEATSVNVADYRKKFFLLQCKNIYYPFFNNRFGYDSFKLCKKGLDTFEMKRPLFYSVLEKGALAFPSFTRLMYKMSKLLLRIIKVHD